MKPRDIELAFCRKLAAREGIACENMSLLELLHALGSALERSRTLARGSIVGEETNAREGDAGNTT